MNFCNVNFVADKELMGRRESGGVLLQLFHPMWYNQLENLKIPKCKLMLRECKVRFIPPFIKADFPQSFSKGGSVGPTADSAYL